MVAYPLGGHPTLNEFVRWAERQKFLVNDGILPDADGKPDKVIRVEDPASGRFVFIAVVGEGERLSPTYMAYLERRLGVRTGFAALDGYGVEAIFDPDVSPDGSSAP